MKLILAGCPFEVVPDEALTPEDRASLEALRAPEPGDARIATFQLELVTEAPWPDADRHTYPDFAPATIEAGGGAIRVTHRRFLAQLRPEKLSGSIFRATDDSGALAIALRAALASRLPAVGGVPLHAAGLLLDGRGVVFFGASGAGKSTLAALAPGAVFSDELVAVTLDPPTLRATGFWGENDTGLPVADAPLAGLVELAQGPCFRLERLQATQALRQLLGVVLVPPVDRLWGQAIALVHRITKELPVYRMEWTPADPPWEALRAAMLND